MTHAPDPDRPSPAATRRLRPRRADRPARLLCALAWTIALAACGGGGSDGGSEGGGDPGGTPAPVEAPVVETVSQTITGEAVVPVGEANCGEAAMQSEATVRLSLLRAQPQTCGSRGSFAAAGQVRWSQQLYEAAHVHSLDMANRSYFEHQGPNGDTPAQRVGETGYRYVRVAENIARGRSGASGGVLDTAAAMQLWRDSPAHCANLMDGRITEIGLACVVNRNKVRYWTLVLARPAS